MNCSDTAALSPLYLSGELDAPRSSAFQAHLDSCRSCAREIARQKELDSRLRESVAAIDRGIDATQLDRKIMMGIAAEAGPRAPAPWWIAAGVTAALIAASLGYRAWHVPRALPMCDDAARDHRHEVIDRQPRTWLSDSSRIEALAESRGVPASAITSLASSLAQAGYRVEHGKLCRLDGRVFLHLVYTDGPREFSVYLRQKDGTPARGLDTVDVGAEHVASFETGQLTAMVVTNESRDAALRLARVAVGAL